MRFARRDAHTQHARGGEYSLGYRPNDRLEIANWLHRHHTSYRVVQFSIIEGRFREFGRGTGAVPHRRVNLDGLRNLTLVRQHSHARVESHSS